MIIGNMAVIYLCWLFTMFCNELYPYIIFSLFPISQVLLYSLMHFFRREAADRSAADGGMGIITQKSYPLNRLNFVLGTLMGLWASGCPGTYFSLTFFWELTWVSGCPKQIFS